jgi:hypothetical protein
MEDIGRSRKIFEIVIFILVILSLIHIILDEYTNFMDFHVLVRKILLITGFAFDLIFTIEFLARIFIKRLRGTILRYFTRSTGIIDFFCSIPALLLYSLPMIWPSYFSSAEGMFLMLGGLMFFKTVRVSVISKTLRFIRILKLFDKIKSKYIMTPEFLKRILTITTVIIVAALIGFYFVRGGAVFQTKSLGVKEILSNYIKGEVNREDFQTLLSGTESVLFIKKGDETVYTSISTLFFDNSFLNDDYLISRIENYEIYFKTKDVKKIYSFINLLIFSIILGIFLIIVTLFRKYFNEHISETVAIMLRGYKSPSYLGMAPMKKEKKELEIYQLTRQFNKKWVPLKKKIMEIKNRHMGKTD